MISDADRREMAATMRAISVSGLRNLTLGEMLNSILTRGAPRPTTEMAILASLADLIDRPTCDVRMGATGHIGVCTRCGAMVEMRAAVFDAIEALPTRYCPNCGAEVIPHAERRD